VENLHVREVSTNSKHNKSHNIRIRKTNINIKKCKQIIFKIFKHSHEMPSFHAFQYANNTHFSYCHYIQIFAPFAIVAFYVIIIIIFLVHFLHFALHQNPKLLISNLFYKHPKSNALMIFACFIISLDKVKIETF